MPDRSFTVTLEPQPEGGFTVHVLTLPEVVTEGETEAEALRMAEDAIALALSWRRDSGASLSLAGTATARAAAPVGYPPTSAG